MRTYFLIFLLIASALQAFSYSGGSPVGPLINLQDTVVFDLSQAECISGTMEFPVYINSDEVVYALDFSLRFDPANLGFVTAINLKPYLVTSAWFNASDSTLRFSSYSMQQIENYTPLIKLRFNLPSAQINYANFDSVYTLLNGDDCSNKFIDPVLPVSIGITGSPVVTPGDSIMLSINTIPGVDYLWSTGATSPVIYVYSPGNYVVTVASVMGCKSVSSIEINSPSPLPVELVQFEAEQSENGILLLWTTASEIFNSYFEIQRMDCNGRWFVLGRVSGAGNSNNNIRYHFIDTSPEPATNLYRLKQVDFDGGFRFSAICKGIYKDFDRELSVVAYPNPAKYLQEVSLEINSAINHGDGFLRITDQKGLEVMSYLITLTGSANVISFSQMDITHSLNPGIYHATIEVEGKIANCRFILY